MKDRANALKTGAILIAEGLINPEDIDRVLAIQDKVAAGSETGRHRLFGSILCDLNLITATDNYYVLKKTDKLVTLQEMLVSDGVLTTDQVTAIQARAAEKQMGFLSLILAENLVSKSLLRQMLFDLFHIPMRSVSDVVYPEDKRDDLSHIIPGDAAKTHQVIPLVLKENNLLCGITEPDALLFIRDLDLRFPQYRFTPMFISHSGFTWFHNMLYREAPDPAEPVEDGLDLSLLLNYQVTVTRPDAEADRISRLFRKYELVRKLLDPEGMAGSDFARGGSSPDRGGLADRGAAFHRFIREQFDLLTRERQCPAVEFSLVQQGRRLMVSALPKRQDT